MTDELCSTEKEFELYFSIMVLINKLHSDGKVERNKGPNIFIGADLDTWVLLGRPKTWSPLIDQFLTGYEKVYKNDKVCAEYLNRFYDFLKNTYTEMFANMRVYKDEIKAIGK